MMDCRHRESGRQTLRVGALVAIVLVVICVSGTAHAQRVTEDQARRQLERAEEALMQLTGAFSSENAATDARANQEAHQIMTLIDQARDAFQTRNYPASYKLSTRALDRIQKIVAVVRRLEQRRQYLVRLVERNREALDLLRRRARLEQISEKADRMLELAADTFHRALDAWDRDDVILSYKLMEQTDNLVRKIIKMLGGEAISREKLARDMERTEELLDNITDTSAETDPDQVESLLERAALIQGEAQAHYEEGNLDFARRLTLRARTLARLALRLAHGQPATGTESILEHTDALIERYELTIRDSENAQAVSLLENAVALQEEAWDLYNDDQSEAALTKTRAAAKLVNAAKKRISRNGE